MWGLAGGSFSRTWKQAEVRGTANSGADLEQDQHIAAADHVKQQPQVLQVGAVDDLRPTAKHLLELVFDEARGCDLVVLRQASVGYERGEGTRRAKEGMALPAKRQEQARTDRNAVNCFPASFLPAASCAAGLGGGCAAGSGAR